MTVASFPAALFNASCMFRNAALHAVAGARLERAPGLLYGFIGVVFFVFFIVAVQVFDHVVGVHRSAVGRTFVFTFFVVASIWSSYSVSRSMSFPRFL
jgi:hypothetical protein